MNIKNILTVMYIVLTQITLFNENKERELRYVSNNVFNVNYRYSNAYNNYNMF